MISSSLSILQAPLNLLFQHLDAVLFSGSDMRTTGNTATATLGMTKFQQMRQLIAVPGIYSDLQTIGGFLGVLHGPALSIGTCPLRSGGLNLIPDGVTGLFDSGLYALIGQCSTLK